MSFASDEPTFTAGRRVITTKRARQQQQTQQQHHGGGDDDDHEQHRGHGRRPRVSLKEKKPVSVNMRSVMDEGAAGGGSSSLLGHSSGGGHSGEGSLTDGTDIRRRVVEVRSRHSREAKLNERRAAAVNQSSGFGTGRGGQRRALIVLPKNAEKMQAREKLMQIHPHVAQLFRGLAPPDEFVQEPFARVLSAEAPTMPYRRRNMEIKSTVEWGERRLFLYELEFLTQYALRPNTVVVYAGCAKGTRLPYLASLFPHVQFVCVDATPLDVDETVSTNIRVRTESFSDALARELHASAVAEDRTLLFISHATAEASLGGLVDDSGAFNAQSLADQKRWYTLLKPNKALLRFSLPWDGESTHYLDGDVILPIWAPPTSTEVRRMNASVWQREAPLRRPLRSS